MQSPLSSPRNRTLSLMVLGVVVALLAETWEARQEDASVLEDLVAEQRLIGRALVAQTGEAASGTLENLCRVSRAVEATGTVRVVVSLRDGSMRDCSGGSPAVGSLHAALGTDAQALALTREEATRLGLPPRTAVAGIVHAPPNVEFAAVAVLSSAGPERDRVRHQQARTVVSVSSVSIMIIGFGLVALRRQRRELALQKQVELARAREERDAELAKANHMATLAALASGFAHEIGTPLGIISGRVEQLRSPNTPVSNERRQELLTQVAAQVDRIGKLIRSFLAFARGDAAMLVQARAEDIARNALRLLDHRFAAAGVHLRFQGDGARTARLTCEPALFEQVIVNLLANALEASSTGQEVTLAIEQTPASVSFVVRDEGVGVPESALERVTEPFFTTKAGRGGSGLGLTIAREIVTHHRGELVIRRRTEAEGSGTEVVVRVPQIAET